jgi:hypothetical protein
MKQTHLKFSLGLSLTNQQTYFLEGACIAIFGHFDWNNCTSHLIWLNAILAWFIQLVDIIHSCFGFRIYITPVKFDKSLSQVQVIFDWYQKNLLGCNLVTKWWQRRHAVTDLNNFVFKDITAWF